jgi:hypothetical protein
MPFVSRTVLACLIAGAPCCLAAQAVGGAEDSLVCVSRVPEQEMKALEAAGAGKALRGVLDRLKVWPAGDSVQACFMGAAQPLRQFFVETSQAWTEAGNVGLDFGPAPGYRDCKPLQASNIRIAFEAAGNWSLVGIDSMDAKLQKEASLNVGEFAGRDFDAIPKDRLRGVILHELGHALGLQHEHQSPESRCADEFDWDKIYGGLGGPPNNWSKEVVDENLRPLVAGPRLTTTPYDRKSIMHYALPVWMFKAGDKSTCFVPENRALSDGDRALIKAAYPAAAKAQEQYLAESGERIEGALKAAGVTQEQAKAIAELAKGIVQQSHPGLKFEIRIENLSNQISATQSVSGNCNSVVGNASGSNITIKSDCKP